MPEMPEIQAHSERMADALVGATLKQFQLLNFAGLKTFSPSPDEAKGSQLIGVGRRAKYLLLHFDNGNTHVVHLMQGGRLRPDPKRTRKPRNGIARWVFELPGEQENSSKATREEAWLLTEAGSERRAGVWVLNGEPDEQEPLSKLAPEAADLGRDQLAEILSQHSKRLHGLLRSQKIISGLGRMLANEICFLAELSPFSNGAKLNQDQVTRLHQAIGLAVNDGIAHERTLDGIGKSADRPSRVHNRAGEPCKGVGEPCSDTIASVTYRNYTVFYCPTHQTAGKLLADNTTSKFLK